MTAQTGLEQESFKVLLEEYRSQINQEDALKRIRDKAWNQFIELGLPTRQTEVYRYLKLRHLFSQPYCLAKEVSTTIDHLTSFIYPECHQSVLVFVNGHYQPHLSNTKALPSKVVISTLQEATHTYGTFLNNQWAKSLREEKDFFAIVNGALHHRGAFIYLPPKTIVEAPLQVLHFVQSDHQPLMLMPRLHLFIGSQSHVSIIVSQKASSDKGYFVNQVAELALEEDSHVHYTQVLCDEHPMSWHLDAVRATLKKNATLKTLCVTEGSMAVRNDYHVTLAGENAEALLNGIWMLAGKRESHTHVFMNHQAPCCRSYQLFKGVLNDYSRSSFEGKIMVQQAAQKTEAFQLNNHLLLSDQTQANSKPNLEIFADDVKASHGATVGQLDRDQLFYMKARGIPNKQAQNLLIYGFCEQVINLITLPSLRKEISERAQHYLATGEA